MIRGFTDKDIKIDCVKLNCKGKILIFDKKNMSNKHKSLKGFLEYLDDLLMKK